MINDTNTAQNGNTAQAAAPQRSYLGGSIFGSPISRSVSSEILDKIVTGLREAYKTADPSFEMSVIPLDRSNVSALFYSIIIVAATSRNDSKTLTAHVLLLESTGEKPRPVQATILDQQVDIMRVSSDAFDDRLYKIASDALAQQFPGRRVIFVDGCVVPSEFDASDKTQVHALALNAGTACGTEILQRSESFADLNIVRDIKGLSTEVELSFDRRTVMDSVGQPMRSDLIIGFANRRPGQTADRASMNNGDRDQPMTRVSAFIDLLFAPQQNTNNIWAMNQNQQQQQKFVPNLIITSMQSELGYTPAMMLMALVTAATANNNSNWVQAFRPSATRGEKNEIDMTDLGAINIEGNLNGAPGTKFGEYQDVKAQNVTPQEINALIAGLIMPSLVMSLDVPDCGGQTWYLSLFRDAYLGRQSAVDTIFSAADQLTNGEFRKNFSNAMPMFENTMSAESNRIHLGYWTDNKGNIRDIRDFDYLAVANLLGRNNPAYIGDWTDTFLMTNYPLQLRLQARRKFIDDMSNYTANYKGFATRVTLSSQFMAALIKSCVDAGLVPMVKVPSMGVDFARQRGVASYAHGAMMSPGMSFGASGSFGQNFNRPGGAGMGFGSRW